MKKHEMKCFDAVKYSKGKAPGDLKAQKKIQKEYARQLQDQNNGINNMDVGDYVDARKAYRKVGREGVSDGNAQEALRKDYSDAINENITASLQKKNRLLPKTERLSREQIKALASSKTKNAMSKLAALHDPDMVAGGADKVKRAGHRGVNSSIGGSWGDATDPKSRVAKMDHAAERAMASHGSKVKMNVVMEPCRK